MCVTLVWLLPRQKHLKTSTGMPCGRNSASKFVILTLPYLRVDYYYFCLTAFFPWRPEWAGTRKVNQSGFYWSKRWWGGSGISWTICKSSAPRSRQINMPVSSPNNETAQCWRHFDVGPVRIPDITKVTSTSLRLWHTITGLMVISYIAPQAVVSP